MAVESRFVVIRHGVEVQTFMDKKAADDYDKMLDMADNLTDMLSETPFEMSDELKEDLSIYLAQNRENVLIALQAKKAKPAVTIKAVSEKASIEKENTEDITLKDLSSDSAPAKKTTTKKKTKNTENEAEEKLL